jgi:hypothetical protein
MMVDPKKMNCNWKVVLCFVIIPLILSSCSNFPPGRFWKSFHEDQIVDKQSDQGPWGGSRRITWKSDNDHSLRSTEVIMTATNNGWIFIDSLQANTKISSDPDDYSYVLLKYAIRELKIESNSKVLRFQTGWVNFEPGNERNTEINGFIFINDSANSMMMFQQWGE